MANYRKNYEDDCCGQEHEHHKDHEEHEDFPKVVLSCGNGSGVSLPVNSGAPYLNGAAVVGAYGSPTLTVGTVTIDTRGLDHPDVKIDFSSLINFRANLLIGFNFRLIFQLSRSCEHGNKIPLSTWIFHKGLDVSLGGGLAIPTGLDIDFEFKEPFSFVWCDCHDCPGCCVYTVEIIDITAYNIESASITNVGISAIASGKPKR